MTFLKTSIQSYWPTKKYYMQINWHILPLETLRLQVAAASDDIATGESSRDKTDEFNRNIFDAIKCLSF